VNSYEELLEIVDGEVASLGSFAILGWSFGGPLALMLAAVGAHAVLRTPVDALPDLSDVQVIVRTPFPGQAPRVVEDQVTYPLTTALLSVPGATTVRGYSFYGDSFVNVLFADGTDPYWARSRVLEYLSQATARLPEGVRPALGPDATGVGWIYQYALVDRSGGHDLAQLRSLQDWFLKFELQALDGVAEVATHALALALASIRNIVAYHRDIDAGEWYFMSSGTLSRPSQMTLGIVGLGRIGKRMAHISRNVFKRVVAFEDATDKAEVDIAMQWNTGYHEGIHSFANNIATTEGGMHEEGFKKALTNAVNNVIIEGGALSATSGPKGLASSPFAASAGQYSPSCLPGALDSFCAYWSTPSPSRSRAAYARWASMYARST
jgi:hypothetical protein